MHVTIRDFKEQKNLIFWIVTRVSARDYTVHSIPSWLVWSGAEIKRIVHVALPKRPIK